MTTIVLKNKALYPTPMVTKFADNIIAILSARSPDFLNTIPHIELTRTISATKLSFLMTISYI